MQAKLSHEGFVGDDGYVGTHWAVTMPASMPDDQGKTIDDLGLWGLNHDTLDFWWCEKILEILRWALVVLEIGDDEHPYPHWHAYLIFRQNKKMTGVIKSLNDRLGDVQRVKMEMKWKNYVLGWKNGSRKTGDLCGPYEIGSAETTPGKRTDIRNIAQAAISGDMTIRQIALSQPATYMKYHGGIEKLWWHGFEQKRRERPVIVWLTGDTGTGKTAWALDLLDIMFSEYYVQYPNLGNWFSNDYHGQKAILFDDFNPDHFPLDDMLCFIGYAPYKRQIKGGFVPILSNFFIFTGHEQPRHCYAGEAKHADWMRRINEYTVLRRDFNTDPYRPGIDAKPNAL